MLILTFIWRAPSLARLDGGGFQWHRASGGTRGSSVGPDSTVPVSREGGARRVLVSMYWVHMIRECTDRFAT